MTTPDGPTPRAHGTLRAIDQFVALCFVSHPRCGWYPSSSSSTSSSHNQIASPSSEAINAVKLVWEMVKDTRRQFAVGPYDFGSSVYWLIKFDVSPLVMGILGDVVVTFDELRLKFRLKAPELEWIDNTRRLVPPFMLCDLATGDEVSLFPRGMPEQPPTTRIVPVHAVNHVWFVAGEFESDLREGKMLGISIGRLADKDPGATSVVFRLGYSAVSHKTDWVFFDKSVVDEVVAVVKSRVENDEKYVFVVIDVEKSFSSQSLCVLSETSIELERELYVQSNSLILMDRAGCRCFIGRAMSSTYRNYCIQFSEDNPKVVVLPQTSDMRSVSKLSSHLFAVSFLRAGFTYKVACDIWDCKELTGPLVRVTSDISLQSAEAASGFLFSVEGNEFRVIEPLTRFTVLHVTLPEVRLYVLGQVFCFP
ncbi:hypothetical protein Pelo_16542 [Pelomyxa schiedti]|nr:hypothetical protein Pelo_16542 [Pelomyxa schiedti]